MGDAPSLSGITRPGSMGLISAGLVFSPSTPRRRMRPFAICGRKDTLFFLFLQFFKGIFFEECGFCRIFAPLILPVGNRRIPLGTPNLVLRGTESNSKYK